MNTITVEPTENVTLLNNIYTLNQQAGLARLPSPLCTDKQSVNLTFKICEFRGNKTFKLVNDRKRTFVSIRR